MFFYSPHPIEEYRITSLEACEASEVMKLPREKSIAVWNLFWLSVPALDVLPIVGRTPDWFSYYDPVPGAFGAITADAIADDASMHPWLLMHPKRFLEFFERDDHSVYDCYYALGQEQWVVNVITRTQQAIRRLENVPHDPDDPVFNNIIALFGKKDAA